MKASKKIRKKHKIYTSIYSNKVMAISSELTNYLWYYLVNNKPTKILDLGSGFSSWLFRFYQKEINQNAIITTVDTSKTWLDTTKLFLERSKLNTDNLYLFDDFIELKKYKQDLILYDMDATSNRFSRFPEILTYKRKNGVMIVDDMHNIEYHNSVINYCTENNLNINNLQDSTLDSYGRYAIEIV